MRAIRTTCLGLGALVLMASGTALAEPWVAPGDARLRHDLELLYDSGVLTGPSLSWPLSWPDIARDLGRDDATTLTEPVAAALLRVRERLAREQRLKDICRDYGISMIGPNFCINLCSARCSAAERTESQSGGASPDRGSHWVDCPCPAATAAAASARVNLYPSCWAI